MDKSFFSNNRQRLKKAFSGTAPIVITANYLTQSSADASYPFVQDSNFWYLTGIDEPGLTLVMEADKEYIILNPSDPSLECFNGSLDHEAMKAISGVEVLYENGEGWKTLGRKLSKVKHVATLQPSASYIEQLQMFTSPARRVLVQKINEHNPDLDLIDLRSVLANLRSVKQPEEIEALKQAIKVTADLYKKLEKSRHSAINEKDLMMTARKFVAERDLSFAYDPVIASGGNATTLHYIKNNSPIKNKDMVLIDIGTKNKKYSADITRTVCSGEPTKRQKAVYDAVLATLEYATGLVRPGQSFEIYEEKVCTFLGEKMRELGLIKTLSEENIRQFYPHRTSHFVGLDTHDAGDYDSPMQTGMIFTVEPGIYIENESLGIRLEDMILVSEEGAEILSASIKKDISALA